MELMAKGMQMLTTSAELGVLYGLMVLGVFLSYRILDIPDLTVDGSFTLGAATSAVVAMMGHPILAIFLGTLAGALAGVVTALLQTKLKIHPILAGILTMTGLYSVNIMVMGNKANLPLLGGTTIFTMAKTVLPPKYTTLLVGGVVILIVAVLLRLLMETQLGLAIRATGDNEDMVRASSINVDSIKIVGLAIANGLVGMSGAMLAQHQSFADANMGTGMIVIGVASLIIGEVVFFGKKSLTRNMVAAVLGAVLYRLIIALALELNLSSSSMKLISAVIVTAAISYPVLLQQREIYKQKRRSQC